MPDFSAQCRLMIAQFENGLIPEFNKTVASLKNGDTLHKGRGDFLSYFTPAPYFEPFAVAMIDAGLPFHKMVTSSFDPAPLIWITFPEVVGRMCRLHPKTLTQLFEDGVPFEAFSGPNTDTKNWEITMDYIPGLNLQVEALLSKYQSASTEEFVASFIACLMHMSKHRVLPQHINGLVEALSEFDDEFEPTLLNEVFTRLTQEASLNTDSIVAADPSTPIGTSWTEP